MHAWSALAELGFSDSAKVADESVNIRLGAKTTRDAQDSALREYRFFGTKQVIAAGHDLAFPVEPETINDHLLFPDNSSDLIDRIAQYLAFTPKITFACACLSEVNNWEFRYDPVSMVETSSHVAAICLESVNDCGHASFPVSLIPTTFSPQ